MTRTFDIDAIRAEFPILSREVNGKPLVYLDNAASAQKPNAVIDGMADQARTAYANVHRGLHTLANETTDAFERARELVRGFLNAGSIDEIIFTKGGTEAVNLVASGIAGEIQPGDEIVLSLL
jgi:cysteine desulfurase/selenocysteine lyase